MKKIILIVLFIISLVSYSYAAVIMHILEVAPAPSAEVEYIVPGMGIINDTEEGFEIIIPGGGIYNQQ